MAGRPDATHDPTAADLVPPEWVALAIPTALAVPPLRPGDRVDVFGGRAPQDAVLSPAASAVARGAIVVAVDDDGVTVAVPAEDGVALAGALVAGPVTLGLLPPAE
jgi:hypothetical protein